MLFSIYDSEYLRNIKHQFIDGDFKLNFKKFIKEEGLKKLAMTKLKSASFSIAIYLFNEIISGVDEIITSRKELSLLLGWGEKQICEGLDELQFYNMIQVTEVAGKPLRVRAQLNIELWNVVHTMSDDLPKKNTLGEVTNLHALHPNEESPQEKGIKLVNLNVLDEPIPFPKNRRTESEYSRKEDLGFGENHPSLNDLTAFREKHAEIDAKIKALSQHELEVIKNEKRLITPDEDLLLQILSHHHQPRKQLLLALRSNLIYPNLKFFLDTARMCAEIPTTMKP